MNPFIKTSSLYIAALLSFVLAASAVNAAQQVMLRNDDGSVYSYNVDARNVDEANSGLLSGVTTNPEWQVKAFADINGDGDNDILMRNVSGAWFAYIIEDGAVTEGGEISITGNTVWEFKAAKDFDGDGSADVILRNSDSGAWFVYLLDGFSIPASGAVDLAFNQDWKFQGAADFDGDGKNDVLLRHQENHSWYLYGMDGVGLNQGSTGLIRFALNPNWTFQAAADFTGDGKADMIMRRDDGPWWMYQADGTEVLLNDNFGLLALTGNTAWQFQAAGDLNGDSRADVLLRHQDSGSWYVYALDGRNKIGGEDEGLINMSTDIAWSFKGMANNLASEPANRDHVVMTTNYGVIEIKLYPEQAPITVANFLSYVDSAFYDNLIFHRVIYGFMIQGGGYDLSLTRKTTLDPIVLEADNGVSNLRGTIAMARTSSPNSATSQFYINHVDNEFLDSTGNNDGYAVFGEVIAGMDVVDTIANSPTGALGNFADLPIDPVIIESVVFAE